MPLSAEYLWLLNHKKIEHALQREFVLAAETSGFCCDFSLPLSLSSEQRSKASTHVILL